MSAVAFVVDSQHENQIVYAPLALLGAGTETAGVISQRGGRLVRFRLPRGKVTVFGRTACVACVSVMVVDGLHWARLPDDQLVWVRDVRDILAGHGADDLESDPDEDPGYDIDDTAA